MWVVQRHSDELGLMGVSEYGPDRVCSFDRGGMGGFPYDDVCPGSTSALFSFFVHGSRTVGAGEGRKRTGCSTVGASATPSRLIAAFELFLPLMTDTRVLSEALDARDAQMMFPSACSLAKRQHSCLSYAPH